MQTIKSDPYDKWLSPKRLLPMLLVLIILVSLAGNLFTSKGEKQKNYFKSLEVPAGVKIQVNFSDSGNLIDCLDVCDTSSLDLEFPKGSTLDSITKTLEKIFNNKFEVYTPDNKNTHVGYSKITPSYSLYCYYASKINTNKNTKPTDYCELGENIYVLNAIWYFGQKKSAFYNLLSPNIPECRTLLGKARGESSLSRRSSSDEISESLKIEFKCENLSPEYFAETRIKEFNECLLDGNEFCRKK